MVGVANLENMCDVIYVRTQTAIIFFFIIRVFINVCHNHYKAVKNISPFIYKNFLFSFDKRYSFDLVLNRNCCNNNNSSNSNNSSNIVDREYN